MRNYKGNGYTKRHFEQIAEVLRTTRPPNIKEDEQAEDMDVYNGAQRIKWNEIRAALVDLFKADNGRFDWERFMAWTEK